MREKIVLRIFLMLWFGLASYSLLSIVVGPGGILATRTLSLKIHAMQSNLASLEARNEALGSDFESLRSDPDRADREARSLGFLARNEYEVVLVGKNEPDRPNQGAGVLIPFSQPPSLKDAEIKLLSVLVALAATLSFGLERPSERARKGKAPEYLAKLQMGKPARRRQGGEASAQA